jgi:hypothetical protein
VQRFSFFQIIALIYQIAGLCFYLMISPSLEHFPVSNALPALSHVSDDIREIIRLRGGSNTQSLHDFLLNRSRLVCYKGHSAHVIVPKDVEIVGVSCFALCRWMSHSLENIAFESGSQLQEIEGSCFSGSSLRSICVPRSVQILGRKSVFGSGLESSRSHLNQIHGWRGSKNRVSLNLHCEGFAFLVWLKFFVNHVSAIAFSFIRSRLNQIHN